ncbi:MAG: prepilin-type N-terminal cleavage/methylation domain-containing protein [Pseudomonadota bacterium]
MVTRHATAGLRAPRARSRGFTLVELMVTLTIMALLLAAAVPLTTTWLNGTRVQDAQSRLLQGYSIGKAIALRNPTQAQVPDAAAGLKLTSDGTLLACAGDPAASSCAPGKAAVRWQTVLPAGITIVLGGNAATRTLAIDNTSLPLGTASFLISKGNENASGTLQ